MESTKIYTLPEIGALLIKDAGLHAGWFEVSVNIGMGVGPIPMGDGGMKVPGAMFGIHGLGLAPTNPGAPNSLDAAQINPLPDTPKGKTLQVSKESTLTRGKTKKSA